MSSFTQSFDQLPSTLPIFPLTNAVFLPGGCLPLNIFETRYLNMVRDAMRAEQLIGMIQPRDSSQTPTLYDVGCAGRIVSYEETENGRLQIVLVGVCRFAIQNELNGIRGYRIIQPDWSDYHDDYTACSEPDQNTLLSFKAAIRTYLDQNQFKADWQQLEDTNIQDLVNSLFNALPINSQDKQILIETDTLTNRIIAFTAILNGETRGRPSNRH